MPFIVPSAAIGGGVALSVWGVTQFVRGDDSADEAVANFPNYIVNHIDDVEVSSSGIKVNFADSAPESAVMETRENVNAEDPLQTVEVHTVETHRTVEPHC